MDIEMKLVVAALAAVFAVAPLTASAAPQGKPQESGQRQARPTMPDLKLSESQKVQLKKIEDQYRPAQRAVREDMEKIHADWMKEKNALLQSKNFDETRAKAFIQRDRQRMEDFELRSLKKEHAMFQVLTPKQQQQFLKDRAERRMPPRDGHRSDSRHGMHTPPPQPDVR